MPWAPPGGAGGGVWGEGRLGVSTESAAQLQLIQLETTNQAQNLGVVMDSDLNLQRHIKTVTRLLQQLQPRNAFPPWGCFGLCRKEGRRSVFGARFSPVVSVWSVPHTHSTTTTAFACIFQCFFCQQVQQSCNSSSASPDTNEEPCPTDMVKMTKSKTFQAYLPSCHRTYSCIHCRAHLANHDELISK
ncbi:hypothetical protein CHARACLAT_011704, partial [Characodon lateralis]|nr:hypothetical protein [Characodon lateralis]